MLRTCVYIYNTCVAIKTMPKNVVSQKTIIIQYRREEKQKS